LFDRVAGLRRGRGLGPVAGAILLAAAGCSWVDARETFDIFRHEHNNDCGHNYLMDVHLRADPGDFAGADAWLGPLWENQIRWRDPFRGTRPVPERPMPWSVPGAGPADRALPSPESSATEEPRGGVPHWPLPQPKEGAGESE
jgi:hypothetical protein